MILYPISIGLSRKKTPAQCAGVIFLFIQYKGGDNRGDDAECLYGDNRDNRPRFFGKKERQAFFKRSERNYGARIRKKGF